MCGRARLTLNAQQVARACGVPQGTATRTLQMDRFRPSNNMSPGAYMPVVLVQRGSGGGDGEVSAAAVEGTEVVVHAMKWGLVPSFTKKTEKPDHYRMFNARSESIQEKASFRRLVPKNRCLVAVEGFYEWKKDGSKKQPYYIHFKDERPLVFAALYDTWKSSDGEILHTFTIITTSSSSTLQWLHDRMPVLLGNKESMDKWLSSSTSKFDKVLVPYEGPDLVWYPVTPAMGKPSFDGPECIKEIQLKPVDKNLISKFFPKKSNEKDHPPVNKSLESVVLPESLREEHCTKESNEYSPSDISHSEIKEEVDLETVKREKDEHLNVFGHVAAGIGNQTEGHGIKREYGQMEALSQESTKTGDAKKKGRSIKTSDGQSTLLSFFGRS